MDVPSGLIRVETSETLQGFVLVVPDSPEHAHYAGSVDLPVIDAQAQAKAVVAELQKIAQRSAPDSAKRKR